MDFLKTVLKAFEIKSLINFDLTDEFSFNNNPRKTGEINFHSNESKHF